MSQRSATETREEPVDKEELKADGNKGKAKNVDKGKGGASRGQANPKSKATGKAKSGPYSSGIFQQGARALTVRST